MSHLSDEQIDALAAPHWERTEHGVKLNRYSFARALLQAAPQAAVQPTKIAAALSNPACERLREWAAIGPVQRAEVESFAELVAATCPRAAGSAAHECTRSHPHENMSQECERLTVIARENNARAHGAPGTDAIRANVRQQMQERAAGVPACGKAQQ